MKKKTDINKKYVDEFAEALATSYEKDLMEILTAPNPFITDIEVTETVPRFYISIPIPYIGKSYDGEYYERVNNEWVFGIRWKELFTLGKKKQKRFLYAWELPKKKRKNSVIKFKRYGSINDTGPHYE